MPIHTRLTRAVANDDLETARALLVEGVDANEHDKLGRTPLMWARTASVIDALVNAGGRIDHRDPEGNTPLHFFPGVDLGQRAERLLFAGADLYATNARGTTPLGLLASRDPAVVRMLLDRQEALDHRPTPRGKPFEEAVANDAVLRSLELDEKTRGKVLARWLLFLDPIELGRLDLLKELIADGPRFDARSVAGLDPVAFACAARNSSPAILRALLDAGCPTQVADHAGNIALDWAIRLARPEAVRLLGKEPAAIEGHTDALVRGIQCIELASHPTYAVEFRPMEKQAFTLMQQTPRAKLEEGPWGGNAATIIGLEGGKDSRPFLKEAGVGWFIPILERLARGHRVRIEEVERAADLAGKRITLVPGWHSRDS